MRSSIHELRTIQPDLIFESRVITFPDDIDRIITLDAWTWSFIETMTTKGGWSKDEIIAECFEQALRGQKSGVDLTDAFEQYARYYVFTAYKHYTKIIHKLANDVY